MGRALRCKGSAGHHDETQHQGRLHRAAFSLRKEFRQWHPLRYISLAQETIHHARPKKADQRRGAAWGHQIY